MWKKTYKQNLNEKETYEWDLWMKRDVHVKMYDITEYWKRPANTNFKLKRDLWMRWMKRDVHTSWMILQPIWKNKTYMKKRPMNGTYEWKETYYYITAHCIWSIISSFSNLNRCSRSLGLFCHVSLKRDPPDWDWIFRSKGLALEASRQKEISPWFKETYEWDLHETVEWDQREKRLQIRHAHVKRGLFSLARVAFYRHLDENSPK